MHAPIATRIQSLKARIDDTHCLHATGVLIDTMTRWLDPEAIPHLIDLAAEDDEKAPYARGALARYGEHAEAVLLERIAHAERASLPVASTRRALERVQYRIRYRQIVGNSGR